MTGDTKGRLRASINSAIGSISNDEAVTRAARLAALVPELGDVKGKRGAVMGYLAMAGELDVSGCYWVAWSYGRGVCVPATDWASSTITPVRYTPGSTVRLGRHRVPELVDPKPLPIEGIGVVLVPGVAFTRAGQRLGRGGGFYDRFIQRLRRRPGGAPALIGVCFEEQVVDELPVEAHDERVDRVVAV
ncbi:MAG: 5-formyltetrahydrofolate cyclo-ligase [Planctomycetota bacterium]